MLPLLLPITIKRADILTKNIALAITIQKTQAFILLFHVPYEELYGRMSQKLNTGEKPAPVTNVCHAGILSSSSSVPPFPTG